MAAGTAATASGRSGGGVFCELLERRRLRRATASTESSGSDDGAATTASPACSGSEQAKLLPSCLDLLCLPAAVVPLLAGCRAVARRACRPRQRPASSCPAEPLKPEGVGVREEEGAPVTGGVRA